MWRQHIPFGLRLRYPDARFEATDQTQSESSSSERMGGWPVLVVRHGGLRRSRHGQREYHLGPHELLRFGDYEQVLLELRIDGAGGPPDFS